MGSRCSAQIDCQPQQTECFPGRNSPLSLEGKRRCGRCTKSHAIACASYRDQHRSHFSFSNRYRYHETVAPWGVLKFTHENEKIRKRQRANQALARVPPELCQSGHSDCKQRDGKSTNVRADSLVSDLAKLNKSISFRMTGRTVA